MPGEAFSVTRTELNMPIPTGYRHRSGRIPSPSSPPHISSSASVPWFRIVWPLAECSLESASHPPSLAPTLPVISMTASHVPWLVTSSFPSCHTRGDESVVVRNNHPASQAAPKLQPPDTRSSQMFLEGTKSPLARSNVFVFKICFAVMQSVCATRKHWSILHRFSAT